MGKVAMVHRWIPLNLNAIDMAFSVAGFVNILNVAGSTGSQSVCGGGRIQPVPGSRLSADIDARSGGRELF
jgi:hypothetical protein